MKEEKTTAALLKQLRNGDVSAFNEIYAHSKKSVYYTLYALLPNPVLVEDIMQETYVHFLEHLPKVGEEIDIVAYLVRSAQNRALDYYRRQKIESEYLAKLESHAYHEDQVLDSDFLKKIQGILNDKEYMVFILRVLGECSFKEISKIKKIPVGTLTWLYQEARKKLQEKLGESYGQG